LEKLVFALLVISSTSVSAQQPSAERDPAGSQIRTTLRAFYFNLGHRDWNALTDDILAAKVVAHRSVPEALLIAADRARGHGPRPGALPTTAGNRLCASEASPLVDRAVITLDGDWAEVSVPHCAPLGGADEFRLIHFEERWRVVYIDLFQESVNVSADR
jgi:hypothetical protein